MSAPVPKMEFARPTAPPPPFQPQDKDTGERESAASARFSLKGKVAIVTGGSGGLGLEASRALLEHGVAVIVILDVNAIVGEAVAEILRKNYPTGTATFVAADVTNAEAVTTAVNAMVMLWGGVDILVAFAGVVKCEDALDMSQAAWKRVLGVNLTGSFICAQAVAKAMETGGRGGSIVLTASISGHAANFPQPQVNYNVSKAGVLMMVKSLAAEWGRYGIRVNSISPGYMNTVLNEGDGLNDHRKIWIERTPLGRIGGIDELNGAVILLCSDAGKFITGTDIKVDGGISALV
ncbi:uncharacterized protein H6S33_006296 [Morchella sextelata]|uniref:uncharacterized protein n=1 Tax=Morchella sextelata TaxID=1174677 RepID=UPI001D045938|nr:uncharacterized protein H6S33_006296 [Morchella sextelata]KAH0604628.1 hypothetical protein H6S33_006296 [Morchella sextelata]